MTRIRSRGRLAVAAVLAAAALGSASPAQAHHPDKAERCERKLERLEERFRHIEEKRGWEAAAEWWDVHWTAYYERCLAP